MTTLFWIPKMIFFRPQTSKRALDTTGWHVLHIAPKNKVWYHPFVCPSFFPSADPIDSFVFLVFSVHHYPNHHFSIEEWRANKRAAKEREKEWTWTYDDRILESFVLNRHDGFCFLLVVDPTRYFLVSWWETRTGKLLLEQGNHRSVSVLGEYNTENWKRWQLRHQ